ncbi:four helix bundle protein [Flavobacterium sp. F372]|uniref:Four helix bundle protein n=1 Tax=Flavobacterium bernardetii TaxID=2813823 RepID=A0ABR7IZD0_9FLAO|nr:four helix bundle protein [Flavobacterium bernardetii]MBC5835002.1 four helix bundle protein [Flavobacterium bernardetii]NHF70446.1 four helix bundle protein [Flavobacterium bernardetii]
MKTYSFENLLVWQKSRILTKEIYKITSTFPKEELFGMTSQMRRCSISIPSNLAECSSRRTNKDKARFTEIAFGSGLELLNQLIIALDLDYIKENQYLEIRTKLQEVTFLLDALQKAQLKQE